jgi:hypothetical protein
VIRSRRRCSNQGFSIMSRLMSSNTTWRRLCTWRPPWRSRCSCGGGRPGTPPGTLPPSPASRWSNPPPAPSQTITLSPLISCSRSNNIVLLLLLLLTRIGNANKQTNFEGQLLLLLGLLYDHTLMEASLVRVFIIYIYDAMFDVSYY